MSVRPGERLVCTGATKRPNLDTDQKIRMKEIPDRMPRPGLRGNFQVYKLQGQVNKRVEYDQAHNIEDNPEG